MYGDRPQVNWFHLLIHDPAAMGVLFVLSLVPTALVAWGVFVGRRIEEEGVPAVASLTWGGINSSAGRASRPSYYVDYAFSPPGSKEQLRPYWLHRTMRATVPAEAYDRIRRTRRVPVRYVRGRPEWNLPQGCRTNDKLLIILVICLGLNFAAICGVVLAVHFRRARRELFARQAMLDQASHG